MDDSPDSNVAGFRELQDRIAQHFEEFKEEINRRNLSKDLHIEIDFLMYRVKSEVEDYVRSNNSSSNDTREQKFQHLLMLQTMVFTLACRLEDSGVEESTGSK